MFSLGTEGTGYQVFHSFLTNGADGITPWGTVVLRGPTLFGTTRGGGGTNSQGAIFSLGTNGAWCTVLHAFKRTPGVSTNAGGFAPFAGLIISGNTLYGTTEEGGTQGWGVVFRLDLAAPAITNCQIEGETLVFQVVNAEIGNTCTLLSAGSLGLPLAEWSPIATNLAASSSLTFRATNGVSPGASQQYYTLRIP